MTLRNISATRELNLLHMSFLRREGLNKGFYCPITSIPLQNTLIPTVIGSVTYMIWPHYHLNLLTFRSISKERERKGIKGSLTELFIPYILELNSYLFVLRSLFYPSEKLRE